ncbi:phenylalanine--tRNA ligase subunit beta [Corynebacterium sp. P7202]|uniref:Phenylalanine--tRNA ligase beta subunit n=1 Tax=Corynebacterium pygosceleis TaxID=2800406 RepID=A0A9Q4GIP3_9CORY|nr:phenylalanine--tRNA ligase subunit beta [Corynebacterium pygosceleis]MCK7637787.1 phenylalanine--tRNA ligase subunit beta [Corynebacterium pygosceleis]MCX7468501.1 phenylalanine--tRNA ligase subunit beta [Corynebacterium pygosceleis]
MLIAKNWVTRLLRSADGSRSDWSVTDPELDSGFVRVGFETEGFSRIPETTGPLVIGRVESIEELTGFKKPIRHCHVNVGDANGTGELQSIVCGARNFSEGDHVVVSLPGCVLPGDFEIAARETYGRMSAGMICSAAELGLTTQQNKGIITLPGDVGYELGSDARAIMGLDDTIFDVNVTPDRGYALSARGLSREIASAFGIPFTDPATDPSIAGIEVEVPEIDGPLLDVDVAPDTKAVRFGLRRVTGVTAGAESPLWMQRELMLCGQRPVNAATDVTNYVMMLFGQPMHAFDAARITGDTLVVRRATEGEKLETLDGVSRPLDPEDVVIADDSGVLSLAGVMGGASSEINAETTDVYLEAANWDPITVARTSRRHKLSSEASRRFERGVDPVLVEVALDVAAHLLARIGGGTVDPGRTLVGDVPVMPTVQMDVRRPTRIAGMEIDADAVIGRLEEVGCGVERNGDALTVTPPTWRPDITMDADLVEEVLRLEGLEDIPSVVPTAPAGRGLTPAQRRRRAIGHALAYNGYTEILPSPFIAADVFDVWGLDADDPRRKTVGVLNPLEAERSVLGTTLLPNMLDAVRRNVSRGQRDVSLYGVEQVTVAGDVDRSPMPDVRARPSDRDIEELLASLPAQPLHVATVGTGDVEAAGPLVETRPYTWADAVESARTVARAADVELEVSAAEHLPWHPGRCAALSVDGTVVGYAGELHPQVLERAGLPARTCAMELDVTALPFTPSAPAPVLSPFPALMQDIALVVDEEVPAEAVRRTLLSAAGDLVEAVDLFDVYRSESLGENRKSLAFALRFRAPDRTLTDDECSAARLAAAEAAAQRHGARIRS